MSMKGKKVARRTTNYSKNIVRTKGKVELKF